MPVPKEILAVERPVNTRVKQSGSRYLVIKRTSKRVNGKPVPVDLGTIGEIIDGKYVEIRKEPRKKSSFVDIKDYGEYALCNKAAAGLLEELGPIFGKEAKRIYVIALLRTQDPDLKDRDLQFAYETSYLSEVIPGVHLSENTVSAFLEDMGKKYRYIREYMEKRVSESGGRSLIVDGMLKDNNSITNDFSEYSRKGAKKGSKDLNLIYAYDPQTQEPVAMKPFPGNMLDATCFIEFVEEFKPKKGILIADKGFGGKDQISMLDDLEGLSYLIPLKHGSKRIRDNGMDTGIVTPLSDYKDKSVFYKKKQVGKKFLYAFRDPKTAGEQEIGYVLMSQKKGSFSEEKLLKKQNEFGVIVFESKSDLNPVDVYRAYAKRWEIEVMFNLYKNILDLDTVNVHGDYRVYATEFINYLSVIIGARVRKLLSASLIAKKNSKEKVPLSSVYSYKQLLRILGKVKRVRVGDSDKWVQNSTLKYTAEILSALGV